MQKSNPPNAGVRILLSTSPGAGPTEGQYASTIQEVPVTPI